MTNTHIDKEAIGTIHVFGGAEWAIHKHVPKEDDGAEWPVAPGSWWMSDTDIFVSGCVVPTGRRVVYRLVRTIPLPADGESSPKAEAGEQMVEGNEEWRTMLDFAPGLNNRTRVRSYCGQHELCTDGVDTPSWTTAMNGGSFTPHELARVWLRIPPPPGVCTKYQASGTQPNPSHIAEVGNMVKPAEPKVMPWPADLRTLFLRRILARFETYAPAWATVVSVNSNTHMTVRLDTGDVEEWNTLRRSLLSVEEVPPPQPSEPLPKACGCCYGSGIYKNNPCPDCTPQPSEKAKGAEWLPPHMEEFDAMARRMDDADMTRWDKNGAKEHVHTPFGLLALGLKERDTQWRSFIESERAQHKAEMEAVKKGASRD